ncbi:CDGSH iron-sulfur domain-containing protein, partial [Klebsiella pneumoniae]|nr:CDGSH iron-sulfur domain-containing protein [Klebsiella pneumoniae]
MFRNVCNCLSISRHLTLFSYENYYNTLFFLKESALFILSSTSLDYMMKLSVWEGGIT